MLCSRYRGPFWWFWQDDATPIPIWTPRAGVFLLGYPCCTTVGPVRRKGQAEGSACSPPRPLACHVSAAHRPGVARGVHGAPSVTGHWPCGPGRQEKEPNQRLGPG